MTMKAVPFFLHRSELHDACIIITFELTNREREKRIINFICVANSYWRKSSGLSLKRQKALHLTDVVTAPGRFTRISLIV